MEYFNSKGQLGPLTESIDANQYDALKSLVSKKVSDPALVEEYMGAYVMVAKQLNMSITEFCDVLKKQGSDYDQDVFLAGYLNRSRVANAKLGVLLTITAPPAILREIRA